MAHPPLKLGTCSYRRHVRSHIKTAECIGWKEQHALTESPDPHLSEHLAAVHHQDDDKDRQIAALTREAGMWRSKYEQLSITYNKLADQWNVFQATARPDNRNIQRAEGAGEATRKLAEVFLALAYDRDAHDLIATLVEMLQDLQRGGAGRTVEVSEKLVRSPDRG